MILEEPWRNITEALENYYRAAVALLQSCRRKFTASLGNIAKAHTTFP